MTLDQDDGWENEDRLCPNIQFALSRVIKRICRLRREETNQSVFSSYLPTFLVEMERWEEGKLRGDLCLD